MRDLRTWRRPFKSWWRVIWFDYAFGSAPFIVTRWDLWKARRSDREKEELDSRLRLHYEVIIAREREYQGHIKDLFVKRILKDKRIERLLKRDVEAVEGRGGE